MTKKAFIYDFDNTVFPVCSIGEKLFAPLFSLIENEGDYADTIDEIKDVVMRQPFQVVANKHGFNKELMIKAGFLLNELIYEGEINTFTDYDEIKKIPGDRFLVTTGFTKLQKSKIMGVGIQEDFKEVHIIDPAVTEKTKKEVFADILNRHNYQPHEVMIIGDDPGSEIMAAVELGIESVLYDKFHRHLETRATYKIDDFKRLRELLEE